MQWSRSKLLDHRYHPSEFPRRCSPPSPRFRDPTATTLLAVKGRPTIVVLVGVLSALLFAAITTAGPVPLADGPPAFVDSNTTGQQVIEIEIETEVGEFVERERPEPSPIIEAIARAIFYAILAVGAALTAAYIWRHRPTFTWRRRRRRVSSDFDVLADVASTISADADAQRAALRRGRPRHAIVECWLRLEAAVADAGVERRPADTSTDLVERVLAGHQVDQTAIAQLAALYREARFSDHDMDEDARQAAIVALDTVHASLGAVGAT